MEILLITLPIFILIALGYVLRALHGITKNGIHALNKFVYWVSLPAVVLVSFWGVDWFKEETRDILLANTYAIFGFAIFLLVLLHFLPFARKTKAGLFVSALVGNTVYMGFPIGERALGEGTYDIFLAAATPHLVIGIAVSVMVIEYYVLRSHNPFRYIKDFFLNPLILALFGGIFLSITNASGGMFTLLREPIAMLASTASPIALVTLGAFLHGVFKFRLAGLALLATVLKLSVLPFLIFWTGEALDLSGVFVSASVLAAAMPTAVTAFVVAEKYDAAPQLVATTLFLSTAASVVTISFVLLFLY